MLVSMIGCKRSIWRCLHFSTAMLVASVSGSQPLKVLDQRLKGSTQRVSENDDPAARSKRFNSSVSFNIVAAPATSPVLPAALADRTHYRRPFAATAVSGGDRKGEPRRARPLGRFCLPAMVWAFVLIVDGSLWRELGLSTAASSEGSNFSTSFRSARGGVARASTGHFVCFHVLLVLALLSHIAVTVADPGFVPRHTLLPVPRQTREIGRWCDRCKLFKPPRAHHCRRCGACVARMDHHCIYAANCVGAGNLKQFLLLLLYSVACAIYANFLYFSRIARYNGTGNVGILGSRDGAHSSGDSSASNLGHAGENAMLSKGLQGISLGNEAMASDLLSEKRVLDWHRCMVWIKRACLPIPSVLILAWLMALLAVQLYGIAVDAGKIDRMQAAATPAREAELKTEVARDATEVPDAAFPPAIGSARQPADDSRGYTTAWSVASHLERENRGATGRDFPDDRQALHDDALMTTEGAVHLSPASGNSVASSEGGIMQAIRLTRGSWGRRAIEGDAGASAAAENESQACSFGDGNSVGGGVRTAACTRTSYLQELWKTVREEILGDGPWIMWLVPTPARLASAPQERMYQP